eukprot:1079515_1
MAAAQVDSDRKRVLWALVRIYTPQNNDNEGARSNPHEDDEKALQYCTKLESLYPDDGYSLLVASDCYSALGLYDKAIHILKRVFSKISALKQSNNPALDGSADFADDIKKRITKTLIRRYHNCPNDSHETIIRYLIELIEWKYNGFQAGNLQTCIEEIWERIEYILNKHVDSVTVNKENQDSIKMESEWNTIWKLLCSIPCSIPLSAHLMNYIFDVFMRNSDFKCGVQFFTRLIAGYQTFNGNGLSIHATFDKYDVLYLNRAKLYHVLGAKKKMLNNIEYCNRRLLRNARDMTKTELVNECNVAQYVIQDANEKPIIETSQQIKISEPVADRNQTNEVDTDEKEEEECKEHATTNDSENENETSETHDDDKDSETKTKKVSYVLHLETEHKDGEESPEQSITNGDSEGETKTQETQDDEDNKDSKAETKARKDIKKEEIASDKQNDNNPNHRRKRDETFHVEMFIYKALRQVHPELEISKTAVRLLNSMAEDAFDRICCEAGRLCQYSNKDTLGAKEIQVATSLVVPCKLAKRAQSKAMVTPYMASEIFDCDSSESDSDSDSSVSIGSAHGVMDKLRNLWLN